MGRDLDERPAGRVRRQDAAANRERILAIAVTAVKQEGVRVPMARIAELAGVGIGTVYRHFPSREHLLDGLTERSFALVLDNARSAAQVSGDARDAIAAFLGSTIEDRDEFVLPWHGGPAIRDGRIRELQSEVWRLVGQIVRRGVEEGSLRDDLRAADLIRFGAMLAQGLPGPDWEAEARRQARIFLAGIAPADGPRR